ncbi:MAG: DUF3788 domain-containing protein [Bryobacteraceae bacterium]|jgi:hypothetical protein
MSVANAFIGKPEVPTDAELSAELGSSRALWDRLLAGLARECSLTEAEWNSYSPKAGWALRMKQGKRNIVYLSPGRGCFMASFALGDKAVRAARAIVNLDAARKYAEGTAVRIDVKSPADVAIVTKLAGIKLKH